MIILGLDVATVTGWAVYDTDRDPSAMLSGSFRTGDKHSTTCEKLLEIRRQVPRLIKEYSPSFAAIEEPLSIVKRYKKKPKRGLIEHPPEEAEEGGMNPMTTVMLSQLAGGATVAVQGHNVPCVQVRAQTWQSVIPKQIKGMFVGPGATKKRTGAYCNALKIVSPNMDSRDACIIAIWAAGHCQELKLLERARAA